MTAAVEAGQVIEGEVLRESFRCYATSKRTREQCGRKVRAAGQLCRWHGGKNPVVAARQELQSALGQNYTPAPVVDPLSELVALTGLAKRLVQTAESTGLGTKEQRDELGAWMDRMGRFSMMSIATQAARIGLEESQGHLFVRSLEGALLELGLDPHDPRVRAVVNRHLRLAMEGAA